MNVPGGRSSIIVSILTHGMIENENLRCACRLFDECFDFREVICFHLIVILEVDATCADLSEREAMLVER